MKKLIITSVLGLSILALNAQVEVTTKSFDLEFKTNTKIGGLVMRALTQKQEMFCKYVAALL